METDDYHIPASQSNGGKKTNAQCPENMEEDRNEDQAAVTSEEHRHNVEPQIKTRSGRVIKKPIRFKDSGLKITAGQRTMTGQKCLLTGHFFTLPVILTGHIFTSSARMITRCSFQCSAEILSEKDCIFRVENAITVLHKNVNLCSKKTVFVLEIELIYAG